MGELLYTEACIDGRTGGIDTGEHPGPSGMDDVL